MISIQFIRINKQVPSYSPEIDFETMIETEPAIILSLKNACYDCHSYQSSYPWYAEIAPLSWWIQGHINGGRAHLNFNEWGNYSEKKQNHKFEECVELLENHEMPLKSYTWLHPEARLNDTERQVLIDYFKKLVN